MHILYFHQHFSTAKGAVGIRSYHMARRLISEGHKVTMVCGSYANGDTGVTGPFQNGRRRGTVDEIDVIECELSYSNSDGFIKRSGIFLKFMLVAIMIVMRERYDLVFATSTPLTVGVPGIVGKWLRRKPFVFEVRDLWPELPREMGVIRNPIILSALSLLEWISYRSADRLVALSPGIAKGIMRRGVAESRISIISNGCDLNLFHPGVVAHRPGAVAQEDFVAIFAGTHGRANGLGAIIEAAEILQQRGRNEIKFLLVGSGMEKPALISAADEKGLTNIIFVDPVPKAELASLLAGSDIGLQILANIPAFYFGTSPNKFFDYIAAGLPVLNNYPGWLAGLIEQHECGIVVPPEDSIAFADALERAEAERKAMVDMSTRARLLAKNDFSRETLAGRWVNWVCGAAIG